MTTPRTFAAVLIGALVVFGGANAVAAVLTRGSAPRQVLQAIGAAPRIDVLALGNSLVMSGFDEQAFGTLAGRRPLLALNAGIGFTSPLQHALIGRVALDRHPEVTTLVYGFFDLMLTDSVRQPMPSLWGNYALTFYTEPDAAARYLFDTPAGRALFHVARRVPLYVERGTLWGKVEKVRRRMAAAGMPAAAENAFGRVDDFRALEFETPAAFEARIEEVLALGTGLTPPLADLFALAHGRDIQIVLVEMPMMASHRERFYSVPGWDVYVRHVEAQLEPYGARIVRAADWLDDRAFIDGLHLGPAGAARFSARLASELQRAK